MRIPVNENISGSVVQSLRDLGHDVLAAKESMRGAEDEHILDRAQAEFRLVVTQEKDFGELEFRRGLPADCDVILFRLANDEKDTCLRRMVDVIESRTDWAAHFSVVTDDQIRMRPLPSSNVP